MDEIARVLAQFPDAAAAADFAGLELRHWRALAADDVDAAAAVARDAGRRGISTPMWHVAAFHRDLDVTRRLMAEWRRAMARPSPVGDLLAAHLELASGRRYAGLAALDETERNYAGLGVTHRAYALTLMPIAVDDSEFARTRAALAVSVAPPSGFGGMLDRNDHPAVQSYLLGRLELKAGDTTQAAARITQLSALPASGPAGALGVPLARGLGASLLHARGVPEDALRRLDHQAAVTRQQVTNSPLHGRAHERFLRAELLVELGRDEEAIAWYATVGELSPFELILLAPSHFRRAQIYERLGRLDDAREHYDRGIELWRDADPDLQPLVHAARQRRDALRR